MVYFIVSFSIFSKEIFVGVPEENMDMYLYKNLEKNSYEGVYIDLLKNQNLGVLKYNLSDSKDDLFLRVHETESGKKEFDYINTPIIYRVYILKNKENNINIFSGERELKVAYIPNTRGYEEIKERYKNLRIKKLEVSNESEGIKALENKDADIFVVKDWSGIDDKNIIQVIENIKYTEKIAIKKAEKELYEKVKNIFSKLSANELQDIIEKNRVEYYKYLLKDTPSYEEIKTKYKELKVQLGKDEFELPFYYLDGSKYKGLTINIMETVGKILEKPVIYTKDKNADIKGIAVRDFTKENFINYTKAYYEMKISVANRKGEGFIQSLSDLDNSKIIVLKDDFLSRYIRKNIKNATYIEVNSYSEGLDKLLTIENSYLVGYFNILTGAISNNFLDDEIKIAGILNDSFRVSLSTKKDDEALSNVLDSILESFTVDKTIIDNELLKNNIINENYELMLKILVPLTIFIVLLIILIIKSEKNRKKAEELSYSLIEVLEVANQLNDEDTGDHVKRLGLYSTLLSKKANINKNKIEGIERYASLHDIGKVAIPAEILKKPSKLTKDEFEKVKEHVLIGHSFVKKLKLGEVAENIVKYHHEKWNGTGYPLGLKEEEIPVEARILAIVDVYDALRQDKNYRKALSHEEALKILKNEKGISFDPNLLDIFLENNKEFEKIYEENKEAKDLATEFYSAIKK